MVFWLFWACFFLSIPVALLSVVCWGVSWILLHLIPWDLDRWLWLKIGIPFMESLPEWARYEGWDAPKPGRLYVENEVFYEGEYLKAGEVVDRLSERTLEIEKRFADLRAYQLTFEDVDTIAFGEVDARLELAHKLSQRVVL